MGSGSKGAEDTRGSGRSQVELHSVEIAKQRVQERRRGAGGGAYLFCKGFLELRSFTRGDERLCDQDEEDERS